MANVPSGFAVKTYVAPSKTGGLGLFAAEPIPKGTVWWRPLLNVNYLRLSRGQFRSLYLSEHTRSPCSKQLWDGINTYSFYVKDDDSLWLVMDNARFVNHSSDSSNSNFSPSEGSVTTRDVAVDEELVEDYRHYDQCPWPEYEETDEFCQQILPKNNELVAAYLAAHPEDPVEPTALVALETYVEDTGSERGMGLYLGKDVTKGEVLWTRTATNHLDIYQAAWRTLCASELEQSPVSKAFHEGVLVYCYYESRRDALVLCLDNARFINHDQNGPVHTMYQTEGAEGNTVFIRDAVKGEELVDDYYEYDECAWAALIWEPYIQYPRKVPPV